MSTKTLILSACLLVGANVGFGQEKPGRPALQIIEGTSEASEKSFGKKIQQRSLTHSPENLPANNKVTGRRNKNKKSSN